MRRRQIVAAREAEQARMRAAILAMPQPVPEVAVVRFEPLPAAKGKMCPKCGRVKAYHFHVKNCRG